MNTSRLILCWFYPKIQIRGKHFAFWQPEEKISGKTQIIVSGPSGRLESLKSKMGEEFPYWRIDDFPGSSAGKYKVTLIADRKIVSNLEFTISPQEETPSN